MKPFGRAALTAITAIAFVAGASAQEAGHAAHGGHRKSPELGVSGAFGPDGRIWVVRKQLIDGNPYVVLENTADMGKTWSAPQPVQTTPEPVAASGEARPHLAFGPKGEIYVSYTKPVAPPHIGDIRFARSTDGGKTFSAPVTVHADREVTVHSFESMVVDRSGRIVVAWIDGRDAAAAKRKGERYAGSAVYYAVSADGGANFQGDYKVADHSCECCRIGLALDAAGAPVAMWRHVFAPNIRDHAIATLGADGTVSTVSRVSFDDWRVEACPHHGPSLAYSPDGTRHQVWFNGNAGEGSGASYAATRKDGTLGRTVRLGSAQAEHPDVATAGRAVAVVWKQFDGKATSVMGRVSRDGGATWSERTLAATEGDADRPHLIASATSIVLLWRTQKEGTRLVPLLEAGR
ncbi:exo-alpha-sialidase [Oxalobacteraceae bacterium OM1]|nr:exo-alpha-sialidase [Oxalobacteraceae bacterium OM1]